MAFEGFVDAHIQRLAQTCASARDVDHLDPQLFDALDNQGHNMASILVKDEDQNDSGGGVPKNTP